MVVGLEYNRTGSELLLVILSVTWSPEDYDGYKNNSDKESKMSH